MAGGSRPLDRVHRRRLRAGRRAGSRSALTAARASPGAIVQGPTTPIPRERDRLGPFARTRSIEAPGPWFETCNILYEAELLTRLGGFDEAFAEALGEDTDLGWRAVGLGAGHVSVEEAAVHHAVDELGAAGTVRAALRGSDSVLAFRRHPGLRERTLRWGVVRNPSLPRLALALAGLALARRRRAAVLLALPYGADLALRCRHFGAGPLEAPVYVAADLARRLDLAARLASSPPAGALMAVAVIGAGTAGLACARRLVEAGVECDVYERWPGLGGQAATMEVGDGLRIERYYHYLFTSDWIAIDAFEQLGLGELLAQLPVERRVRGRRPHLALQRRRRPAGHRPLSPAARLRMGLALLRLRPGARRDRRVRAPDGELVDPGATWESRPGSTSGAP